MKSLQHEVTSEPSESSNPSMDTGAIHEAIVERVEQLTPLVTQMTLQPQGFTPRYRPGQWIELHLPAEDGSVRRRAYYLAEAPAEAAGLTIVFDHPAKSETPLRLAGLEVGDTISWSGPAGTFALPNPLEVELVWVARDMGIVPFRCMARALPTHRLTSHIHLICGFNNLDYAPFHREFLDRSVMDPNFDYTPVALSPIEGWGGAIGSELNVLRQFSPNWNPDHVAMICGEQAFTEPIRAFFAESPAQPVRSVQFEGY